MAKAKKWIVIWWPGTTAIGTDGSEIHRPLYAIFDDFAKAEVAALVRNALMIDIDGDIIAVHDYKYLNELSEPIEADVRELNATSRMGFRM